jgi:hypothetical protein
MTGINRLPKETLYEIVSYLSTDFSQLLKCRLVCQELSEVANGALYRDIDLTIFVRNNGEAAAKNKCRRQLRLLGSISEYLYSTHITYHYLSSPLKIQNWGPLCGLSKTTAIYLERAKSLRMRLRHLTRTPPCSLAPPRI